MDTNAIAIASLVLVLFVILYLLVGIIIKNKWPDNKANRFFGGDPPALEEHETITNILLDINDVPDVDTRSNILQSYLNGLHMAVNNIEKVKRAAVIAIEAIINNTLVNNEYKQLVLDAYKDHGIIDSNTVSRLQRAIEGRALRRANAGPLPNMGLQPGRT